MKSGIAFKICIISFVLLTLLIGCKPSSEQQQGRAENGTSSPLGVPGTSPGAPQAAANADDMQITSQVQARLAGDDLLRQSQIDVETNNGVVRLSGSVSSTEAMDKAAQVAQSVNGVTSVQNDLSVG